MNAAGLARRRLARRIASQWRTASVLFLAEMVSIPLLWVSFSGPSPTAWTAVSNASLIVWTMLIPAAVGAVIGWRVLDIAALVAGMIVPIALLGLFNDGPGSAPEYLLAVVVWVAYLYAPITVVAHLTGVGIGKAFRWWRSLPA